jgi:uncharacterized protein
MNHASFTAPLWLPGGHAQTIYSALFARRYAGAAPQYQRQRWTAPDGDFVDVDFLQDSRARDTPNGSLATSPAAALNQSTAQRQDQATAKPLLVLFHGLEGSSHSHYAQAFAAWARAQGLGFCVPHFRGCSGEMNLAPRAYHSGDFEEIDWILRRVQTLHPDRTLLAVGVSLGGNALLRWAQEMGQEAQKIVRCVAAICSPLDLAASGAALGQGLNAWVYTPRFLRSMKPRALAKLTQHPGLFDRNRLLAARNLYEFDNAFTAPLHGFKSTEDYWARASSKPHLTQIQVPALVLNALNDPFVPAHSLPHTKAVGQHVTLWQPRCGGHVGFAKGRFPATVQGLPQAVGGWCLQRI